MLNRFSVNVLAGVPIEYIYSPSAGNSPTVYRPVYFIQKGFRNLVREKGPPLKKPVWLEMKAFFGNLNGKYLLQQNYYNGPADKLMRLSRTVDKFRINSRIFERFLFLELHNIVPMSRGCLKITYHEEKKQDNMMVYEPKDCILRDIFSAIRQQDHAINSYIGKGKSRSEQAVIKDWQHYMEIVNTTLRNKAKCRQAQKRQVLKNITPVVKGLSNCRNPFKTGAGEQADLIIAFEDMRGRYNPPAFAARTIKAIDELEKRLTSIDRKLPEIILRKSILGLELKILEMNRRAALSKINDCLKIIDNNRTIRLLSNKIKLAISSCCQFWFSPYFYARQHIIKHLNEALRSIENIDMTGTIDHLKIARYFLENEIIPKPRSSE